MGVINSEAELTSEQEAYLAIQMDEEFNPEPGQTEN